MKTRIYLSGPMRYYPNFNHAAFHRAAKRIRDYELKGAKRSMFDYEIFSPAERDETHPCPADITDHLHRFQWYLRRDIKALMDCDMVVVLPGWELSTGCDLEVNLAKALHIPVITLDHLLDGKLEDW